MYENITYEKILKRMLEKVTAQNPNIDSREGSIIYNALAPAAVEMQNMYIALDTILNETFADTQSREYLIKRCAERGITPYPATKAILKGEFNIDVPLGTRFSLENTSLNYTVIEKIAYGIFKLECEMAGTIGNYNFGSLIPIEYINGLQYAKLTELLIPGKDEEDTESLRKRYFASFNEQAFGGNIQDYKTKVNALAGVGGVKVYPAWNGPGTVGIVIISSEYKAPTQELIKTVQEAVAPTQNQGQGVGIAPIGHIVKVNGVTPYSVCVETKITFKSGYSFDDENVKASIESKIDEYFMDLNKTWADSDHITVRISQLEAKLLELTEVIEDVKGTKLNGEEKNKELGPNEIAVREEIVVG